MYRLRFNTIEQLFNIPPGVEAVLPASDILKYFDERDDLRKLAHDSLLIAEIPSVIWEGSVESIKKILVSLKDLGVFDVLCENIGGFEFCEELGLKAHGGMYLNVLNVPALKEYDKLGAKDVTLSFEMPFNKQRAFLGAVSKESDIDAKLGIVIYGYLPLMKFRACPAMGKDGCKGCTRDKYLKDRKGEKFRILCHGSKYSELLNCVPLYAADKTLPSFDFYTAYFTVESKEECEEIFRMIEAHEIPEFRHTSGLYKRELL